MPALLQEPARTLCVVIDVLRLSSTVASMFGRGLREALVVATPSEARRAAKAHRGMLLCGEAGGVPPRGFDYGNSPAEFDRLDLSGRRAVLTTTNGTPALARAAECPVVLVGALLNASAVADAALKLASAKRVDITMLCAGEGRGRRFSLEDAFAAGALVEGVIARGRELSLGDGARAAQRIYRSYRGRALPALRDAEHGRALDALGLGRDVKFCARRDVFAVAPRLRRRADGSLWLRAT